MKKIILFFLFFILLSTSFITSIFAKEVPDTVHVGIYITSIHDIDFRQKEYTVNLWLWLTYKNKEFDFSENLEIPESKTVTKSFFTVDSSDDKIFMMMKLQCIMKDSWKIGSFPFDNQKLRLSVENSQFDSRDLVFTPDSVGKHFGKYTISGWNIDSLRIAEGNRTYETAFGDETLDKPQSEYSAFKVMIIITRDSSWEFFLKIFLGMYISFLISFICFFIHTASVESRFGLSVGSLFAVIGNKYIIDSSMPETTSFTLVDTLHGITLLFILSVVASTAYMLHLAKEGKSIEASRFNKISAIVSMLIYVALNVYFIVQSK